MQTPFCGGSFEALLPQLIGNARYPTHAVGKWVRHPTPPWLCPCARCSRFSHNAQHLGFCHTEMTPAFRGYNSFMGYHSCAETDFTHEVAGALDFRLESSPRCGANCSQPLFGAIGTYSSFLIVPHRAARRRRGGGARPLSQ